MDDEERKATWDLLFKKMRDLNLSNPEKEFLREEILHKEAE